MERPALLSEEELWNTELELISPTLEYNSLRDIPAWLAHVLKGEYREFFISCRQKKDCLLPKTIADVESFTNVVKCYLENCQDNRAERELEILSVGVTCLQLFVTSNWTGPQTSTEAAFSEFSSKEKTEELLQLLEADGEHAYQLIDSPILLCLAMKIFQEPEVFVHCKTSYWWCMRYITVHQRLLPERSPYLHNLSATALEMLSREDFISNLTERSHKIQLHLESGLLQLHYYQYKDAEKNFETARNISGISCNLDGALGVRTRFQQKPVAQLRVQIERTNEEILSRTPDISPDDIPKALALNDDTLLESVKFTENEEIIDTPLSAEEHAVILTICTSMQRTSPSQRLRDEQIMCIIEHLLSNPKSWPVHTEALRVRCLLERERTRTVERSMTQLESLVNNISPKSKDTPIDIPSAAIKRLSLFYSVWPKPSWILQKQLATLFESLGVRSSALEIYTRLHMWEEAIVSLMFTGRGHEAEKLIREQLAIKETASLLCLLGDVLQDPEQYSKAWEVSKHRSARAMRCLGAYKISKKLYNEAVECFQKSLNVNYLQIGTWFNMGCAAMANEDYEKAAKSFQKCVSLNWDNFEAWTNLSTAFVRSNKKLQAYKALTEGLKCNFQRWELWENFLFVSVDTGHFGDVIRAYNRLLDLKDKYLETAVLRILVRAITENMEDAKLQPASKQLPKALELFGRLTSKSTSDWEVWSLYAKLLGDGVVSGDETSNNKAFHCLQKALRSSVQRSGWEKDGKSAVQNVDLCNRLVNAFAHSKQFGQLSSDQLKTQAVPTRLTINGVKAKLKMQEKSLLKDDAKEQYDELVAEVENKLQLLNELISNS